MIDSGRSVIVDSCMPECLFCMTSTVVPDSAPAEGRGRSDSIVTSGICWADLDSSDDSMSFPGASAVATKPEVRPTVSPTASPCRQNSTEVSELSRKLFRLTRAAEGKGAPSRGFGFLMEMSHNMPLAADDSKDSSRSMLMSGLEDTKRSHKRCLSSSGVGIITGDTSTASKFRRVANGDRLAAGPSSFPEPGRDPVFGHESSGGEKNSRHLEPNGSTRRKRYRVARRRQSIAGGPEQRLEAASEEQWQLRFEQRAKQVEIGKKTESYVAYRTAVSPSRRRPFVDPVTPDPTSKLSKRAFEAQLRRWRKSLHSLEIHAEQMV